MARYCQDTLIMSFREIAVTISVESLLHCFMISPCKFILASVKVPLHISLASYNVIIVYFLLFLAQLKKTDGFDNILTLAPN